MKRLAAITWVIVGMFVVSPITAHAQQRGGNIQGLRIEFITKYFDAIHMESISHQNKIMNS